MAKHARGQQRGDDPNTQRSGSTTTVNVVTLTATPAGPGSRCAGRRPRRPGRRVYISSTMCTASRMRSTSGRQRHERVSQVGALFGCLRPSRPNFDQNEWFFLDNTYWGYTVLNDSGACRTRTTSCSCRRSRSAPKHGAAVSSSYRLKY